MTNVDSSWEASVIKLAQAGNLRAITFWINRYLVPQGMCTQVTSEPSGGLLIQVVCRQAPDAEQLMHFLCHRLCKLNSDAIRQVQVTAQMVGSAEILWKKSARILPPPQRTQDPKSEMHQAQVPAATPVLVSAQASLASAIPSPVGMASNPVQQKPVRAEQARAKVHPAAQKAAAQPAQPTPVFFQSWQAQLNRRFNSLKTESVAFTDQSVRWFAQQKPAVRGFMLGGSALAAFLIGCGFELAGYYADPNAFQQSKATLTGILRTMPGQSNTVETAANPVPVIHQPVLNPDDPTISLIFSNPATLTRLPANQPLSSPTGDAPPPLITAIENYRLADMIVTNLSSPLSLALPVTEAASGRKTVESKPESESSAPELRTPLEASASDSPEQERGIEDPSVAAGSVEEEAALAEGSSEEASEQATKQAAPFTPQELAANGVDVVNIATDALVASDTAQLTNTIDLLRQNGIHTVGAGSNLPEARRPQIFEVKGKRIAYLGYSDSSPQAVTDATAGINIGVNQQMEEDIKAIREQVDWIVVNFNWDRQLKAYPETWQTELAHAAVDHGADLVVGYHPTMTQGAEIYNGRAIVYSLGNAIDEYSEKPAGDYETAALKVTLKDHVMELEFLPVQVKKGQAEVAKGELGSTILQYLEQASSLFDHPLRSPTTLNAQLRLSLPSAPDTAMPTDPFISYPEAAPAPTPDTAAP